MATETVSMPSLGESVMEGTVVEWLVKVGDRVEVDDLLCEIETDKANTEIPSPSAGFVVRLLVDIDESIEVGSPLLEIGDEKPDNVPESEPEPARPKDKGASSSQSTSAPAAASGELHESALSMSTPALQRPQPTPVAASEAQRAGSWEERVRTLGQNAPSVPNNGAATPARPSYAQPEQRRQQEKKKNDRWLPFGHPDGARAYKYPQPRIEDGDTVEKFSRRRAIIAEHMVVSQSVSPHVVTVAEVDMTDIVTLRNAHKKRLKAQGIGVTYLTFLLKATCQALREFPDLNAVVGEGKVIKKGRINLGCAVETPAGLVVPVLRDADQLNMIGLAKTLDRLAGKARDGNLAPDDISGGTFTVSNPGLRGNLYGGAIINQPQVGILRMGEIKKRPMVITRDGADVIAIRYMMYLALSYDHRVIDGVTGNSFLYRVRELLEGADFAL